MASLTEIAEHKIGSTSQEVIQQNDHAAENAARDTNIELLNVANCLLQIDSTYSNRAIRQTLRDALLTVERLEALTEINHGYNSAAHVQAWAVRMAIAGALEAATCSPGKGWNKRVRQRAARALQLHFNAGNGA